MGVVCDSLAELIASLDNIAFPVRVVFREFSHRKLGNGVVCGTRELW